MFFTFIKQSVLEHHSFNKSGRHTQRVIATLLYDDCHCMIIMIQKLLTFFHLLYCKYKTAVTFPQHINIYAITSSSYLVFFIISSILWWLQRGHDALHIRQCGFYFTFTFTCLSKMFHLAAFGISHQPTFFPI